MSNGVNNMPKGFRLFFGIFMAVLFMAVGLDLLFNWPVQFIYDPSWNLLRWIGGPIFILYGIFRGYRMIKGDPAQNEG